MGQGEQNQRPGKCLDSAQTTAVGSLCRDRIWMTLLKKFHVVSDNLHHPTTGRILFAVNTKATQHIILDIFPEEYHETTVPKSESKVGGSLEVTEKALFQSLV